MSDSQPPRAPAASALQAPKALSVRLVPLQGCPHQPRCAHVYVRDSTNLPPYRLNELVETIAARIRATEGPGDRCKGSHCREANAEAPKVSVPLKMAYCLPLPAEKYHLSRGHVVQPAGPRYPSTEEKKTNQADLGSSGKESSAGESSAQENPAKRSSAKRKAARKRSAQKAKEWTPEISREWYHATLGDPNSKHVRPQDLDASKRGLLEDYMWTITHGRTPKPPALFKLANRSEPDLRALSLRMDSWGELEVSKKVTSGEDEEGESRRRRAASMSSSDSYM